MDAIGAARVNLNDSGKPYTITPGHIRVTSSGIGLLKKLTGHRWYVQHYEAGDKRPKTYAAIRSLPAVSGEVILNYVNKGWSVRQILWKDGHVGLLVETHRGYYLAAPEQYRV